jgi:CheY-like chemotaxis protein
MTTKPEHSPKVDRASALVLLVDDDADSRELYAEYLSSIAGFEVMEAADGRQAVDLTRERAPDVVVMDMTLPILDGRGAMQAIRGDEKTRATPIIALTGRAELRSSNEPATEFQVVLVKPCLPSALAEAITALLEPKIRA